MWAEGGGHACGSLAEGACGLGRARRQAVGRAVRSWAVREAERAQLGFGAGASEVSGLGESWLGRAREGRKGVGRGFGWARLGLGWWAGFLDSGLGLILFYFSFSISNPNKV